jgi:shikimate kinase
MKNVTLIGMPGSGKSTVGVLLAKALGFGFLDVDLVIQHREGALLQDILDSRGVDYFLDREEEAVCSVCCDRYIIAPGGSAVLREKGAAHLRTLGPVVYLNVPVEELQRRIRNMGSRGIAMKPGQTLADVLAYRAPYYEKCADVVVDYLPGSSLEDTVSRVLEKIRPLLED